MSAISSKMVHLTYSQVLSWAGLVKLWVASGSLSVYSGQMLALVVLFPTPSYSPLSSIVHDQGFILLLNL